MPLDDRQRDLALELLRTATGTVSPDDRALVEALLRERADTGGETLVAGVAAPVEIWRDARGIPHIRASTTDDLFFAHGYVQAQDRLWQLDYLRRQANGRLSEIFGDSIDRRILFIKKRIGVIR